VSSLRTARATASGQQASTIGRGFARLLLDAAARIEIGDWKRDAHDLKRALRERAVADAAMEELDRRRKKICKHGKKFSALNARRRHKLRIKAKKLRYATEFFAGVFSGKKQKRVQSKFIARLKALQDALGDLNDIIIHQQLAKAEAEQTGGRCVRAAPENSVRCGPTVRARERRDTACKTRL
jgi:CHAD domain-containing protein